MPPCIWKGNITMHLPLLISKPKDLLILISLICVSPTFEQVFVQEVNNAGLCSRELKAKEAEFQVKEMSNESWEPVHMKRFSA